MQKWQLLQRVASPVPCFYFLFSCSLSFSLCICHCQLGHSGRKLAGEPGLEAANHQLTVAFFQCQIILHVSVCTSTRSSPCAFVVFPIAIVELISRTLSSLSPGVSSAFCLLHFGVFLHAEFFN